MPTPYFLEDLDFVRAFNAQQTQNKTKIAEVPRDESGWPLLQLTILSKVPDQPDQYTPALGGGNCHYFSAPLYFMAILLSKIQYLNVQGEVEERIFKHVNQGCKFNIKLKNFGFHLESHHGPYGEETTISLAQDDADKEKISKSFDDISSFNPFGTYKPNERTFTQVSLERHLNNCPTLNGGYVHDGQIYIPLDRLLQNAKVSQETFELFALLFNVEQFNALRYQQLMRTPITDQIPNHSPVTSSLSTDSDLPSLVNASATTTDAPPPIERFDEITLTAKQKLVELAKTSEKVANEFLLRNDILAQSNLPENFKKERLRRNTQIIVQLDKLRYLIKDLLVLGRDEDEDSALFRDTFEFLHHAEAGRENFKKLFQEAHPKYKDTLKSISNITLASGTGILILGIIASFVLSGGGAAAVIFPAIWYLSMALMAAGTATRFFSIQSPRAETLELLKPFEGACERISEFNLGG